MKNAACAIDNNVGWPTLDTVVLRELWIAIDVDLNWNVSRGERPRHFGSTMFEAERKAADVPAAAPKTTHLRRQLAPRLAVAAIAAAPATAAAALRSSLLSTSYFAEPALWLICSLPFREDIGGET